MPEGHTIRYLSNVHRHLFTDTVVAATSPQGRFSEEAEIISGRALTGTSAHGKHLFLHFGDSTVHVHLGLYGWFRFFRGGDEPSNDNVRLRLDGGVMVSDLSGPTTCELMPTDEIGKITARLGPDPIHGDADREKAWNKIHKSKKTIAALLMDQSVIAGIGNVYRAEFLFMSDQNPFVRGADLPREKFDEIWENAAWFLREGSKDGMIRTVDPGHMTEDERSVPLKYTQNSYVYKRTGQRCRICGNTVMSENHAGRELYWCPTCQI